MAVARRQAATKELNRMIVTEKEALGKVCPMTLSRSAVYGTPAVGTCTGSACMWWEWKLWAHPEPEKDRREPTHGHCGQINQ